MVGPPSGGTRGGYFIAAYPPSGGASAAPERRPCRGGPMQPQPREFSFLHILKSLVLTLVIVGGILLLLRLMGIRI